MTDRYRIRITPKAASDLNDIFDYISADSATNAISVVRRILKQVDSLDLFPSRTKTIGWSPELRAPIHSVPCRPFVIYFAVLQLNREVHVLHVRHGARTQPTFDRTPDG